MRAAGVEVAEEGAVPLLGFLGLAGFVRRRTLRGDVIGDGGLGSNLGVAVGVRGTQGAFLRDGDHVGEARGVAVDRSRGREDNVVDIVVSHGAQQADRAVDIDFPVVERDFSRFANGLTRNSEGVCRSSCKAYL